MRTLKLKRLLKCPIYFLKAFGQTTPPNGLTVTVTLACNSSCRLHLISEQMWPKTTNDLFEKIKYDSLFLSITLQPLQTLPSHPPLRGLRQTSTNPLPSLSLLQPVPRHPPRQTLDLSRRGQISPLLLSTLLCKKIEHWKLKEFISAL